MRSVFLNIKLWINAWTSHTGCVEWTSHLSSATTTTSTTMGDKLIVCASKHQALSDKFTQIIESVDIRQEHFYVFIFLLLFSRFLFFSIWWAVRTDSTNDLCEYDECHLCAQREDITLKKNAPMIPSMGMFPVLHAWKSSFMKMA